MKNEHYYKQELENLMDEFITEQHEDDSPFGWIGENTTKLMVDAAWSVLMASKDVQNFLIDNGELKP